MGRPKRTQDNIIQNITLQLINSFVSQDNGCWIWKGLFYANGYGRISRHLPNDKFNSRAHIASYQLHKGKIKKGLFVCHSCDNKKCINPEHLWLGTNQENQIDASKKGLLTKHWTEEKRLVMSKRMQGKGNPMFGKSGSKAPCYGRTGVNHPMFGKTHSQESKNKISQGLKRHYEKK